MSARSLVRSSAGKTALVQRPFFLRAVLASAWWLTWVALAEEGAGQAPATCRTSAEVSGWASPDYHRTHTFGTDEESGEWIASFAGMATMDGSVFVFDRGRPVVLELSSELELLTEIGRLGGGPGEFNQAFYLSWPPRYHDSRPMGAARGRIVAYDQVDLEVFDQGSTASEQLKIGGRATPFSFGIRYVEPSPVGDSFILVRDSIEVEGDRQLRVSEPTTASGRMEERLLWSVPLPWEGGQDGLRTLSREARPYWAGHGSCHVASAGSSEFLFRYDLDRSRLDTLPLPRWPVPRWGEEPEDRRQIVPSAGGGLTTERNADRPLALARWSALVVDPDGHVWIRPWTPLQRLEGTRAGDVAFVISIETGEAERIELPAFPLAFGEPGVFYTLEEDPETDALFIARYEMVR